MRAMRHTNDVFFVTCRRSPMCFCVFLLCGVCVVVPWTTAYSAIHTYLKPTRVCFLCLDVSFTKRKRGGCDKMLPFPPLPIPRPPPLPSENQLRLVIELFFGNILHKQKERSGLKLKIVRTASSGAKSFNPFDKLLADLGLQLPGICVVICTLADLGLQLSGICGVICIWGGPLADLGLQLSGICCVSCIWVLGGGRNGG